MKFLKWFSLARITLYLFAITLGLFIFALVVPIQPVKINSITVASDMYKAGDQLVYKVDRCRNIEGGLDGIVYRSLVRVDSSDQLPVLLLINRAQDGERGCGIINRTVTIPSATPAGTYKLELRTEYQVFFFRPAIKNTNYSNEFEVIR